MNIEVNFDNLTKEEQEQFNALVEKASKPKRAWKPIDGEMYYCINHCRPSGVDYCEYKDREGNFDERAYSVGNCFKTREEAEFALERLKVITEMKRYIAEHDTVKLNWEDNKQEKYLLEYNYAEDTLFSAFTFYIVTGGIYTSNIKIIDDMIEAIGEDRIKKYYFGVE